MFTFPLPFIPWRGSTMGFFSIIYCGTWLSSWGKSHNILVSSSMSGSLVLQVSLFMYLSIPRHVRYYPHSIRIESFNFYLEDDIPQLLAARHAHLLWSGQWVIKKTKCYTVTSKNHFLESEHASTPSLSLFFLPCFLRCRSYCFCTEVKVIPWNTKDT